MLDLNQIKDCFRSNDFTYVGKYDADAYYIGIELLIKEDQYHINILLEENVLLNFIEHEVMNVFIVDVDDVRVQPREKFLEENFIEVVESFLKSGNAFELSSIAES